jgi:hypothetical protein
MVVALGTLIAPTVSEFAPGIVDGFAAGLRSTSR